MTTAILYRRDDPYRYCDPLYQSRSAPAVENGRNNHYQEVVLVKAELNVAESPRASYNADVSLWIPISGTPPDDQTFEALRYGVVERVQSDYDTLTDRTTVEDSAHVYDPDENRFAPRSPDATIGPEVRSGDGATLVCPITTFEWFGLTSVRTCSLGVLESTAGRNSATNPTTLTTEQSPHDDGGDQHDRSRSNAEWIDVRTPCRAIADAILNRTREIPTERLYLAGRE